ncbi:hypothetical protein BI041_gp45 [Propionibacterium phage PFR2]|uniref:Uncharacterized protein n=2 Tax=Pulverervirus PFR1 TaxID=2170091 RepID=A0A173G9Y4_9CAUD|nr:hypothetical protein [Propionibacterium freudenreichii]YP_009287719.1 hypothetical protein BI042_gp43 [Propionibacterium phage PFR1]YP_009290952.1 hypothetical protein BI041_gp45 [Propionibacterium phage PFR2]ANH49909.1 hypothetical protein PFR_43 [Propionibacterium phage PFR1]ANH49968.1 hypothetical protein PFR2_43 [Propionibacterium phage PFR2]MDK9674418.1 hypothetical protein [Propionibacterium freudenreichii]CEI46726.1 Protein of unknown function [Propionibacterium freudenreichii]SCQ4
MTTVESLRAVFDLLEAAGASGDVDLLEWSRWGDTYSAVVWFDSCASATAACRKIAPLGFDVSRIHEHDLMADVVEAWTGPVPEILFRHTHEPGETCATEAGAS